MENSEKNNFCASFIIEDLININYWDNILLLYSLQIRLLDIKFLVFFGEYGCYHKRKVLEIKGTVQVSSSLGKGNKFTIKLPLALSIIDGILFRIGDIYHESYFNF